MLYLEFYGPPPSRSSRLRLLSQSSKSYLGRYPQILPSNDSGANFVSERATDLSFVVINVGRVYVSITSIDSHADCRVNIIALEQMIIYLLRSVENNAAAIPLLTLEKEAIRS